MKINKFILMIMAVIAITPIFLGLFHPAVLLVLFVLWLITAIKATNINFVLKDPWKISFWWIMLLFWEIGLSLSGYSSLAPANFFVRIPYYCTGIITAFVIRCYDFKQLKSLFSFIVIVVFFNLLHNAFLYILNPDVFGASDGAHNSRSITNIGNTSFVQACLFFIPCCFFIVTKSTSRRLRQICILGSVLAVIYIAVINTRATTFLLFIVGVISFFYVKLLAKRIKSRRAGFCITIAILGLSLLFLVPFLEWLSSLLSNDNLVVRIESITESVQTNEISDKSGSSLFERFTLAMVSINTWLSSPQSFILGIGEDFTDTAATLLDLEVLGIGQHSQILDFLAMYGLFGTFLLFKALKSIVSCINNMMIEDKDSQLIIRITYILYFLCSILNNTLFANMNFVTFLLFPLAVFISSKSDNVLKSQLL